MSLGFQGSLEVMGLPTFQVYMAGEQAGSITGPDCICQSLMYT